MEQRSGQQDPDTGEWGSAVRWPPTPHGLPVPERLPAEHERVFAARMRRERLRRGWRQEDLAKYLSHAGLELHPSAIAKMEREPDPKKGIEPRAIRLGEAAVIAAVLNVTPSDMLADNDLSRPVQEIARLEKEIDEITRDTTRLRSESHALEERRVTLTARLDALRAQVREASRVDQMEPPGNIADAQARLFGPSRINRALASLRRVPEGEGYDPQQVDNRIIDIQRKLLAWLPTPAEFLDIEQFRLVPGGYAREDVDAAFERITVMLSTANLLVRKPTGGGDQSGGRWRRKAQ